MVKITGTGSFLPDKRVSNDDLSLIMDTSDEWIRTRTGISARHLAIEETTSQMALTASEKALSDAKAAPEELDLIIAGTVSADQVVPSLACNVQSGLGAEKAVAFDINAACSGFLFSLNTAWTYLEQGIYRKALVIGAETLSKIVNWEDRSTCVLFGDGAGAAVVEWMPDVPGQEQGVIVMEQGSCGSKGQVLACDDRPVNNPYVKNEVSLHYVTMDGQEVFKFAARTVPEAIMKAVEKAGLSLEEIDYFLLHQANLRIIEAVAKRLRQPSAKFPTNIQDCANTSAASVPILLDYVNRKGLLKPGDKIVLAGFGAGLTWGVTVICW